MTAIVVAALAAFASAALTWTVCRRRAAAPVVAEAPAPAPPAPVQARPAPPQIPGPRLAAPARPPAPPAQRPRPVLATPLPTQAPAVSPGVWPYVEPPARDTVSVAELRDRLAADDTQLLRQVAASDSTDHRARPGTPGGLANGATFQSR